MSLFPLPRKDNKRIKCLLDPSLIDQLLGSPLIHKLGWQKLTQYYFFVDELKVTCSLCKQEI